MAKFLNIDELVKVEKEVQIGGEVYPIAERTIGQVITAIQASNREDEMTMDEQMQLTLELVQEAIPTCPVEKLKQLPFSGLNALMTFINDSDIEGEIEGKQ